ncbi:hypothetical protein [Candidatus Nitronereus thalassa]|uniref:DUF839 domain-containing protein n=1 Tax=Candidatus Nitronereus thalassa TaxID=3020898 RepID=A0ABU3KA06_9BACT|nr:hypothetical protein [Candidatus Nitronereus thalassa]MDT7043221.1 DUF839 domain-containing protein [Candidatus Nitronereus thalassa]
MMTSQGNPHIFIIGMLALLFLPLSFYGKAEGQQASMLTGLEDWHSVPIVTVGDHLPSTDPNALGGRYQPVGKMDGLGAMLLDERTVRVFVNHELRRDAGYPYRLRNETLLTGARVSFVDLDRKTRVVVNSGLAFDSVIDRQGKKVTSASQINQAKNQIFGFSLFCSAQLVEAGQFGFVDTIFFTHEEVPDPIDHPHGGSLWALDVASQRLYAVPAAGRMAWENTAPLSIGGERVAFLIGDDAHPQSTEPHAFGQAATSQTSPSHVVTAPLWLFIGKKNASLFEIRERLSFSVNAPRTDFLNRNGLLIGDLYYFTSNDGRTTIDTFHSTGEKLSGKWIKLAVQDSAQAGQPGYDEWGYKNGLTLRREAKAGGAFQFSRPEDVSTHPRIGTRAVLASTGRDTVFSHDAWGALYQVDVDFDSMSGLLTILYDGDDAGGGQVPGSDYGIRNPDNLDWADDGFIYVQEDMAKSLPPWFGGQSHEEASVWQLDPLKGTIQRVARMNRSIGFQQGETESSPEVVGAWESSGILDVTHLFEPNPGEKLFLSTIQAHSVQDGLIAKANLFEGGQLVWLIENGY